MGAFVEHSFEAGFILDEERLRKIREIVATRLANHNPVLSPKFKVFRGDSYSYITESLEDVILEDNDDWRKITKLEILVEQKDDIEFRLSFSKDGIKLNINGENRDEVFLIFSDLREYIKNDVTINFWHKYLHKVAPILLILLMLGGLLFVLWGLYPTANSENWQQVLKSDEIQLKLNYLVEQEKTRIMPRGIFYWAIAMAFLFLIVTTDIAENSFHYFFPNNEFFFGKRKQMFEKKKNLLSNILWIVLVGLVVSILGGIIVWYVTTVK